MHHYHPQAQHLYGLQKRYGRQGSHLAHGGWQTDYQSAHPPHQKVILLWQSPSLLALIAKAQAHRLLQVSQRGTAQGVVSIQQHMRGHLP